LKRHEVIRVRGREKPDQITVNWTERGPIISPEIIKSLSPISLRWSVHDGGREFGAFFSLNKAENWDEFQDALSLYNAPSQNVAYADVDGNIGYALMGKIPLRSPDSALFPFPGWIESGRWQGFLKDEGKVSLVNPEDGIIVTANNRVLPESFPYYLSVDWDLPFRADRIRELLEQRDDHDIESFMKIQSDIYAKNSEVYLQVLEGLTGSDQELGKILNILRSWDRQMGSGKAPLLYKAFIDVLTEKALKDELGDDFLAFDFLFRRKHAGLMRILSDPHSPWYDNKDTPPAEIREEIVRESLRKAYEQLTNQYGEDKEWDWGSIHSIHYTHLLGEARLFRFFNRGPFPVYGDAFTVNASFSKDASTTHGPSYRQIIDLSDMRNSVCVITSGQSGHFLSRHYDDQISLWLEGQYHPMLFHQEDIEANMRGRLLLKPEEAR
jgi:penicillin amidase